jgi:hypothetical protein
VLVGGHAALSEAVEANVRDLLADAYVPAGPQGGARADVRLFSQLSAQRAANLAAAGCQEPAMYIPPDDGTDTDGDGVPDLYQFDTTGDGEPDLTMVDLDQDGNPDEIRQGKVS